MGAIGAWIGLAVVVAGAAVIAPFNDGLGAVPLVLAVWLATMVGVAVGGSAWGRKQPIAARRVAMVAVVVAGLVLAVLAL